MDAAHINLHKVIGAVIIGTWVNLMLFVLVIDRSQSLGLLSTWTLEANRSYAA
ncbi:hypothetical protein D9758_009327 [Tetrapyrgos nigripes]|uniref:Uncharacterized protein n=1 Tax=Tetrapyrgos nigripes TaxID=182062 RepID=A0A8H5GH37_9AGAR|nr:hypothetical protein D9758_009327 [Tetrapyrgos nigripes]